MVKAASELQPVGSLAERGQLQAGGAGQGPGAGGCLGSKSGRASSGQTATAQPWPSPKAQGARGDMSEDRPPFHCSVHSQGMHASPSGEAKHRGAPPPIGGEPTTCTLAPTTFSPEHNASGLSQRSWSIFPRLPECSRPGQPSFSNGLSSPDSVSFVGSSYTVTPTLIHTPVEMRRPAGPVPGLSPALHPLSGQLHPPPPPHHLLPLYCS